MSNKARVLWTLLTVTAVAAVVGFASWSAFSSTTQTGGNEFDAGTVHLSDNDGGSFLYDVENRKPTDSVEKCIKVSYGGTLDATVRLYMPTAVSAALGDYATLKVEAGSSAGSPTFPDCGTFTTASTLYSGKLSTFASAHTDWASGKEFTPTAGGTKWATGDTVVYRVTVTLDDDNAANKGAASGYVAGSPGYGSGAHTYRWEARNL